MIAGIVAAQRVASGGGGGGGSLPTVTWNPSDMATQLTLSNANLTVTRNAGSSPWRVVRATDAHTTGKRYFEVLVVDPGAQGVEIGVATAAFAIGGAIDSSAESWAIYSPTGALYYSGSSDAGTSLGTIGAGQRAMWAVDFDAGKAWIGRQGTFDGNPGAGTGERFTFTPGLALFPAAACYNAGDSLTGAFKAADFAYSLPSGFGAWGG